MRFLTPVLLLGIILMGIIPGMIGGVYAQTITNNVGAKSSSNTNATQYLQGVVHRAQIVLAIVVGGIMAFIWVWRVLIPYFSHDKERRAEAKEEIKDLGIATIIVAMALGGFIWLIARYIAGV